MGKKLALEASIVWLCLGTIYLLTLADNHAEAEDTFLYLVSIRDGNPTEISHPHHLAYGWVGWFAYQTALISGYSGGPLLPIQVFDALTGALGIALLWAFLRRVASGRIVAVVGCGTLGFSYGYWWYSVEVEVYILSAVLLICSLFFAYRAAIHPSWKYFALLGGANGLAVLAHQTNVLFASVAIMALLLAWRILPMRDVVRCALAYVGFGISVVLPPYMLAILVAELNTPAEIYDWLTMLAQNGEWGGWEGSTVPETVLGIGRALVGGHFLLSLDPVRSLLANSASFWRDEQFLVRDFNPVLAVLLFLPVIVIASALLFSGFRWIRHPRPGGERAHVLAVLCLSWLVPYTLFFMWWQPMNIEFWIAPWIPLAILFALGFSARENGAQGGFLARVAMVFLGMLFTVNFVGSVWPQQDPDDDYWHVRSLWYRHNATSSDLVIVHPTQLGRYIEYYARSDVYFVDFNDELRNILPELQRQIEASRAQRVLFSSSVFYPYSDEFWPSRCPRLPDRCAGAKILRREFLPRSHIVSDEPLEEIRELEQR